MYVKYLFSLSLTYRLAIERARDAGEFRVHEAFVKFPTACCGDTACLLGQYLLEHGIDSEYVCGYCHCFNKQQYHAWLHIENLIVDITGDQFKHNPEFLNYDIPVYVGKMDPLHELFAVSSTNTRKTAPVYELGWFAASRLTPLYNTILKYVQ